MRKTTFDIAGGAGRPNWPKSLTGFAILFALYQAAEGLQTVFAPASALGPALMLATLIAAWPVGRWLGGRGYDRFGLALSRGWITILVGGMLLAGLAKLAALSLALAAHVASPTPMPVTPGLGAIAMAALTTFVPSVAEDILTRGFLLRVIPLRLGFWSYVLASAALYTLNHIWRFDWGLSEQLRLFCLGLAYAAAAWRWRSLWGAVALHWGWNFANLLADQAIPLAMTNPGSGRMISAAIHLMLLAIVLLLPSARTRRKEAGDWGA